MTRLKLNIHLANWDFIPSKNGAGWGTYLRFSFLCFTLSLEWQRAIERDIMKAFQEAPFTYTNPE